MNFFSITTRENVENPLYPVVFRDNYWLNPK